jgi:hypothetical protein
MFLPVAGYAEKHSIGDSDDKIRIIVDTDDVVNVPPFASAAFLARVHCADADFSEEVLVVRSLVEKLTDGGPLTKKLGSGF